MKRLFHDPGVEWEPKHTEAGEAGVAGAAEGVPTAAPGWGRGRFAATPAAVLWAAVSPVQEEDAAIPTQPGAGPAQRGNMLTEITLFYQYACVSSIHYVIISAGETFQASWVDLKVAEHQNNFW